MLKFSGEGERMNRDAAENARDLGDAALRAGDFDRALRMFTKSKQLFALDGIDARIQAARSRTSSNPKQHQQQSNGKTPASSSSSSSKASNSSTSGNARAQSAPASTSSASASASADVAPEQIECVRRIVETTCYYEVLQVQKGDIAEVELKKGLKSHLFFFFFFFLSSLFFLFDPSLHSIFHSAR
jgi:hypothetical protein